MDAIRNWLYIGRYRDTIYATLLEAQGISAMLQLAEAVQQPGVESLYLQVEDGVPLVGELLRKGVDFVLDQKHRSRKVLVACGAGMSRSAAYVVAVLKEDEGLSLLEALRTVKHYHPETIIHPVLWISLCKIYQEDVSWDHAMEVMDSME